MVQKNISVFCKILHLLFQCSLDPPGFLTALDLSLNNGFLGFLSLPLAVQAGKLWRWGLSLTSGHNTSRWSCPFFVWSLEGVTITAEVFGLCLQILAPRAAVLMATVLYLHKSLASLVGILLSAPLTLVEIVGCGFFFLWLQILVFPLVSYPAFVWHSQTLFSSIHFQSQTKIFLSLMTIVFPHTSMVDYFLGTVSDVSRMDDFVGSRAFVHRG